MGKFCEKRLKLALKARHFSQRDFAEQTGLSEKHISQLVNGIRNITPKNAVTFSKILKVREAWLLGIDDFMTEEELQESLLFDAGWDSTERTDIIDKLLFTDGYSIVPNRDMSRFEKDDTKEITSFDVSVYYKSKKLCELTDFEHEALADEIADFASYVIKKVIEKKGRASDGE